MSLKEAAHYVGLGTTKFDELVDDGTMPQPRMAGARVLWDVFELDAAFERLPKRGEQASPPTLEDDAWNEMAA